jgi:hypothetical protein
MRREYGCQPEEDRYLQQVGFGSAMLFGVRPANDIDMPPPDATAS